MGRRCGWAGTVEQFLNLKEEEFLSALVTFIPDAKEGQIIAWRDCYQVLQTTLQAYKDQPWILFFEYELPREGGRRPDVLLLLPGDLLVLEFKMQKSEPTSYEWEQLSSYIRDFQNYHQAVQHFQLKVRGSLVLTSHAGTKTQAMTFFQLYRSQRNGLGQLLSNLNKKSQKIIVEKEAFLTAGYEPLPTIVEAAKKIMKHELLPNIKQVNNTNIPIVLETMKNIAEEAKMTKTHHLILLTGVPGAGKTLVGLQFSYMMDKAVYLSGNGPLVDVLQDALQTKTFVQALRHFKQEYSKYNSIPHEHILIFDEAQRAWDQNKMKSDLSEPDLIIKIAQDQKDWSVIVGLIGEGQEIHVGEEGGLKLWNHAIQSGEWVVHSHEKLAGQFNNAKQQVTYNNLNLNQSLRSHLAVDWHTWVHFLLEGKVERLKEKAEKIHKERFNIYVTRDLEHAKRYAHGRYKKQQKQYGLVTSSRRAIRGFPRETNVLELPRVQRYQTPSYVSYYNHPNSEYFSSNLTYAASEFETQGLELDLVIVCWGYDLQWNGVQWENFYNGPNQKDPKQLRLNSYRVLLTRGRDGVVVYIPNTKSLDLTYDLFINCGAKKLV